MTDADPVWTAVARKRAIRRFAERPLDPQHLRRIVDAGRRSGSSKNTQPWDFVVVQKRDTLRELGKVGPYAGHLASAAAGIALVTPDPATTNAPLSVYWDLGQAAQNMMLVAWELGVGSVPATVYDADLAKEILGYPDDRHCEFLLSFGYPAREEDLTRPPKAGGRRPLEEIVHPERW
jgi:nitroreductase